MSFVKKITELPISSLIIGRYDLRTEYENGPLESSIKRDGIKTPILVCPSEEEGKYDVIDGNRRVRIAMKLRDKTVPANITKRLDHAEGFKLAIVTNIHRASLSPRDEARAIQQYRNLNPEKSLEVLAVELAMSPRAIREKIGLVDLSPAIKVAKKGTPGAVARKTGALGYKVAAKLAESTRIDIHDEKEREKKQEEIADAIIEKPHKVQRDVIKRFHETPSAPISEIVEEVETSQRQIVTCDLSPEVFGALVRFQLDRALKRTPALRLLILEGLKKFGYVK